MSVDARTRVLDRLVGRRVRITIEGIKRLGTLERWGVGRYAIDGKQLVPDSQITLIEERRLRPVRGTRYTTCWRADLRGL